MDENGYSAKDIVMLSGPQGVRKRPAMYIGSTSSAGFNHLLVELIDNSVDEATAGFCSEIGVVLSNEDGMDVAEVSDNGRGIPVDIMPKVNKPALEVIMTSLHSGAKFASKIYKVSGGLHGVGLTVVNSLSEYTVVTVKKDGKEYRQTFSRGSPTSELKVVGDSQGTGTTVRFKPDKEIFSVDKFDGIAIEERLRDLSFLNPGLLINFTDDRYEQKVHKQFVSKNGMRDFIDFVRGQKQQVTKPIVVDKSISDGNEVRVQIAMQYVEDYSETLISFVNRIKTGEGGAHVTGFHSALTRSITNYLQQNSKKERKSVSLEGADTREGLIAIISILMQNPEFEGQTKEKLGNASIKSIVDTTLYSALSTYLEENPEEAGKVMAKVKNAADSRESARRARELARKKGMFEGSLLSGKLADCTESDPNKAEIFIVEGDSAAGCFSGDTEIALADGRNVSFKNLTEEIRKGKQNFCYTITDEGSIGIQRITNSWLTKKNTAVIKVVLDNGQEIICTPNHAFMLKDGSYVEARSLNKKNSLMPFHKRISRIGGKITIKGYEMVWDQNKAWVFTHMLADEYNLQNGTYTKDVGEIRHHVDFNKRNNNPTNITRLTKEAHLSLHAKHLDKTMLLPTIKRKAALAHQSESYRKKMREWASRPEVKKIMSRNSKKLWKDAKFKAYMKRQFLDFYNSNYEYKKGNNTMLYEQQRAYWAKVENREKASSRTKSFFEQHPSRRKYLSKIATEQWKDKKLLNWRRQETKKQWTWEFRMKRRHTYNKTYYTKTISLMKTVMEKYGSLKSFDLIRIANRNHSALSSREFCSRFFDNNIRDMLEAVNNYNHKIKRVEFLEQKADVYDIEVPHTHNFALASGVFVHNSSKQGRDRFYQAILPLRGKVLNVEKATDEKIFSNKELHLMVTAFGTGIKETFDSNKLRYSKIIFLTDADVDGSHIRTLLLTFFYRYLKPLIEHGNVYIAQPPLYKVSKGKEVHYAYNDSELDEYLKKLNGNATIQRYKGLGEMNPEQLWETTMDPKRRLLKRITINDAELANSIFSVLMGLNVEERRKFLEEHSKEVNFLDV